MSSVTSPPLLDAWITPETSAISWEINMWSFVNLITIYLITNFTNFKFRIPNPIASIKQIIIISSHRSRVSLLLWWIQFFFLFSEVCRVSVYKNLFIYFIFFLSRRMESMCRVRLKLWRSTRTRSDRWIKRHLDLCDESIASSAITRCFSDNGKKIYRFDNVPGFVIFTYFLFFFFTPILSDGTFKCIINKNCNTWKIFFVSIACCTLFTWNRSSGRKFILKNKKTRISEKKINELFNYIFVESISFNEESIQIV